MNQKLFEKLHRAFLRAYLIDTEEFRFRRKQKEYRALKKKVEEILGDKDADRPS